MSYTFDGTNKLIIINSTSAFTAADLYSRWKDWVQTSDNSKYVQAMRSIAGDPIGPGLAVAPYIFLNTTDGWRIRPSEANHELNITGNLYSEDASLSMFVPTLGGYMVNVIIERSSAAIAVTVGGVDQATVQAAMTAQGFTTSRAPKLDQLDASISSRAAPGQGLTSGQSTSLDNIEQVVTANTTVLDDIYHARFGRWLMQNNQIIFYKADNVTELARFDLFDKFGNPTMVGAYERRKV